MNKNTTTTETRSKAKWVSLYLTKAVLAQKINVFQIAIIAKLQPCFVYYHWFVQNAIKNANNAFAIQTILPQIKSLLTNHIVVLKNDADLDLIYLNQIYRQHFKQPFMHQVYDVAKNATFLNFKKTTLSYLCQKFQIHIPKTNHHIPNSVIKAHKLLLVAQQLQRLENG